MSNSLISRGAAGGDLPRQGWESLEKVARLGSLDRSPFPRHPFREKWNLLETKSKCLRSRRFASSSPHRSLSRRVDTWIYSPSPRFNGNSKFPSQGGRRREEEEGRKEGRKVVETSEPPSSRGLEYSAVFLRFEEDLVSRKRREKEEDKSEERDGRSRPGVSA